MCTARISRGCTPLSLFDITLLLSALLCSLVAGFLFAYAIVIMPGIEALDDIPFIRAFQVTDRVIQDNQPLFMLVWIGSAVALVVCAVSGVAVLRGVDLALLLVAAAIYLVGVQAMTVIVHLPLNNALQKLAPETLDAAQLQEARAAFEHRWSRFNRFRTALACTTTALLLVLLFRL